MIQLVTGLPVGKGGLHPLLLLQSGVPPERGEQLAKVECAQRDLRWLDTNIESIAALNTLAFAASPWNEKWSMNPHGIDPRRDSFAMVRELIEEVDGETYLFSATVETEEGPAILGAGISVRLNKRGVESYHVGEFGGHPGDWYPTLVFVQPNFRGSGIFRRLADARLQLGLEKGSRRMYVQTHAEQGIVQKAYAERGFQHVGNLEVRSCSGPNGEMWPSKRVMMKREFS